MDEFGNMLLKDLSIDNPLTDKHGPNQMSRLRPLLTIRDEDTISQKVIPLFVKLLAFTIVSKLTGKDCLDVLVVSSEYGS